MNLKNDLNTGSDLVFSPEENQTHKTVFSNSAWKILIVDDEPDIHEVTQISLMDFDFDGRELEFLNAYSAQQAKEILSSENNIAVALIDVVMENEHAGLDVIKYIRQDLNNNFIRLILRTGQPG